MTKPPNIECIVFFIYKDEKLVGHIIQNYSMRISFCRHEDRDKALLLCSWHFERDSNRLSLFLEQLEKEQAYTRAAAIAVFNLKIRNAIEILSRAPDGISYGLGLNVVAMALAGFSDDKNSIWKQFCTTAKQKLTDPYLKAIFSFLTAENFNYDGVLVSINVYLFVT